MAESNEVPQSTRTAEREVLDAIRWRRALVGGLIACAALLAFSWIVPVRGQPGSATPWSVFDHDAVVAWPWLLRASVWLGLGACACVVAACLALPKVPGALDRAPTWLVRSGALALLALRVRDFADPLPALDPALPLRSSLAGLTPPVFVALACGGLIGAIRRPDLHAPRLLAAAGAAGLLVHTTLPVGWIGHAASPLLAAFSGVAPWLPRPSELPPPTQLAGGFVVVAYAAAAVAVLALLAIRRAWTTPAALAACALLLVPTVLWPLRAGVGSTGAALHLLACVGLAAMSIAVLCDRCRDETLRAALPAAEPVAVGLVVAAYAVLKVNGLRYSTTDEALYFYAAQHWADGHQPYRDFFFSHPPLHIAVPAVAYWVAGGFHFLIGKVISAAAGLGAGLGAWSIARRFLGAWPALAVLALDLFACEVLQASTNLTGVNQTACWLTWGAWAVLGGRPLLGGALLGAATSTGFYAVGAAAALFVLSIAHPMPAARPLEPLANRLGRHPALLVLTGFLAVWGGLHVYFSTIAGDAYRNAVFAYHVAKRAKTEGYVPLDAGPQAIVANVFGWLGARDFAVTVYFHAAQYWLALLAPVAVIALRRLHATAVPTWRFLVQPRAWWREPAQGGAVLLCWLVAAGLLVEFAQFKERYDFYYALILPLVCVCAGASVAAIGRALAVGVTATLTEPALRLRVLWSATAAAVLVAYLWVPVNLWANRTAYPSEFEQSDSSKGAGERLTFGWTPAPGPPWLSELSHAVFWQGDRVRGNVESGVHHYLWGKKRWFSTADEIAEYIQDHTRPDETITGASDYAPLLALLSGRRLAGNQIDTNSKVFTTGAVPVEQFWDRACADQLKYIVVAPMSYFAASTLPKRATIMQHFRRDAVFRDPMLKHWKTVEIELWARKSQAPCRFEGRRGAGPNLDGSDD
jgi:hypothetical protein